MYTDRHGMPQSREGGLGIDLERTNERPDNKAFVIPGRQGTRAVLAASERSAVLSSVIRVSRQAHANAP